MIFSVISSIGTLTADISTDDVTGGALAAIGQWLDRFYDGTSSGHYSVDYCNRPWTRVTVGNPDTHDQHLGDICIEIQGLS